MWDAVFNVGRGLLWDAVFNVGRGVWVQVVFKVRVDTDAESQVYLEQLLDSHPQEYSRADPINDAPEGIGYANHYDDLIPNTLYIKLDDDIVFIHVSTCGTTY
jgi:hypothetical protein